MRSSQLRIHSPSPPAEGAEEGDLLARELGLYGAEERLELAFLEHLGSHRRAAERELRVVRGAARAELRDREEVSVARPRARIPSAIAFAIASVLPVALQYMTAVLSIYIPPFLNFIPAAAGAEYPLLRGAAAELRKLDYARARAPPSSRNIPCISCSSRKAPPRVRRRRRPSHVPQALKFLPSFAMKPRTSSTG